ncbi:MAG: hypothetical protein DYG98_09510 [Haliscomenobacteraceae bacterium CHB4]|nr:hypothetical protein [Haliscomenobacteraceae bacterium CHB4]
MNVSYIGNAAFTPPGSRAFTPEFYSNTAINGLQQGGVNAALPINGTPSFLRFSKSQHQKFKQPPGITKKISGKGFWRLAFWEGGIMIV